MTDPRCGTYAGYQVHLRAGETTCPDCRAAAAADRRRRAAFEFIGTDVATSSLKEPHHKAIQGSDPR